MAVTNTPHNESDIPQPTGISGAEVIEFTAPNDNDSDHKKRMKRVGAGLVVLTVGAIGFLVGNSGKGDSETQATNPDQPPVATSPQTIEEFTPDLTGDLPPVTETTIVVETTSIISELTPEQVANDVFKNLNSDERSILEQLSTPNEDGIFFPTQNKPIDYSALISPEFTNNYNMQSKFAEEIVNNLMAAYNTKDPEIGLFLAGDEPSTEMLDFFNNSLIQDAGDINKMGLFARFNYLHDSGVSQIHEGDIKLVSFDVGIYGIARDSEHAYSFDIDQRRGQSISLKITLKIPENSPDHIRGFTFILGPR